MQTTKDTERAMHLTIVDQHIPGAYSPVKHRIFQSETGNIPFGNRTACNLTPRWDVKALISQPQDSKNEGFFAKGC